MPSTFSPNNYNVSRKWNRILKITHLNLIIISQKIRIIYLVLIHKHTSVYSVWWQRVACPIHTVTRLATPVDITSVQPHYVTLYDVNDGHRCMSVTARQIISISIVMLHIPWNGLHFQSSVNSGDLQGRSYAEKNSTTLPFSLNRKKHNKFSQRLYCRRCRITYISNRVLKL